MNTLGATSPGLRLAADAAGPRAPSLEATDEPGALFVAVLGALKGAAAPEDAPTRDPERPAERRAEDKAEGHGLDAQPETATPLDLLAAMNASLPLGAALARMPVRDSLETLVARALPNPAPAMGRMAALPDLSESAATTALPPRTTLADATGRADPTGSADPAMPVLRAGGDEAAVPASASAPAPETRTRATILRRETHFAPVLPRILAAPKAEVSLPTAAPLPGAGTLPPVSQVPAPAMAVEDVAAEPASLAPAVAPSAPLGAGSLRRGPEDARPLPMHARISRAGDDAAAGSATAPPAPDPRPDTVPSPEAAAPQPLGAPPMRSERTRGDDLRPLPGVAVTDMPPRTAASGPSIRDLASGSAAPRRPAGMTPDLVPSGVMPAMPVPARPEAGSTAAPSRHGQVQVTAPAMPASVTTFDPGASARPTPGEGGGAALVEEGIAVRSAPAPDARARSVQRTLTAPNLEGVPEQPDIPAGQASRPAPALPAAAIAPVRDAPSRASLADGVAEPAELPIAAEPALDPGPSIDASPSAAPLAASRPDRAQAPALPEVTTGEPVPSAASSLRVQSVTPVADAPAPAIPAESVAAPNDRPPAIVEASVPTIVPAGGPTRSPAPAIMIGATAPAMGEARAGAPPLPRSAAEAAPAQPAATADIVATTRPVPKPDIPAAATGPDLAPKVQPGPAREATVTWHPSRPEEALPVAATDGPVPVAIRGALPSEAIRTSGPASPLAEAPATPPRAGSGSAASDPAVPSLAAPVQAQDSAVAAPTPISTPLRAVPQPAAGDGVPSPRAERAVGVSGIEPAQRAEPASTGPAPVALADQGTPGAPLPSPSLSGAPPQALSAPPAQQVAAAILGQMPRAPSGGVPGAPGIEGPLRLLTLQLHPADLGIVLVRMRLRDGQLEMTLRASREETATLLREGGEALADLLRQGGYQPERVTVVGGPPPGGPASAEGQAFPARSEAGANPDHATPDQPDRRQPDGRAAAPDTSERNHESVSSSPDRSGVYL